MYSSVVELMAGGLGSPLQLANLQPAPFKQWDRVGFHVASCWLSWSIFEDGGWGFLVHADSFDLVCFLVLWCSWLQCGIFNKVSLCTRTYPMQHTPWDTPHFHGDTVLFRVLSAVRTWLQSCWWLHCTFIVYPIICFKASSRCKHDIGTLLWKHLKECHPTVW